MTTNLANEFYFVALNILDAKNIQLSEEMQGKVVDGISENRFLNKQDIALGLLDLLAHVQQVSSFLLQNLIHLAVVVNDDLVFHLLPNTY